MDKRTRKYDDQGQRYQRTRDLNYGDLEEGELLNPETNATKTIDYPHHELHRGSRFVLSVVFDIPADDWLDIRITTPNTTKWAHMEFFTNGEAEERTQVYEGVTIETVGTELTPINRNRNSANVSAVTFDYIINTSEANANADTSIASATMLTDRSTGAGRGEGGQVPGRAEYILKQNTIYTLRVHNVDNTSERYCDVVIDFYEHTNKNG